MFFVEIYKLQNDGTQQVVVTCKLKGDTVKCEGNSDLINVLKQGILNYSQSQPQRLFPDKDGLKFLEQLRFNFRSGYISASKVKKI